MSLPSGRPEAATFQVQRLVERVLLGEARIPPFQRGFRWGAEDVLDLLDSVYRGFPIGTLLLWKKPAEAAGLNLGPLPHRRSRHEGRALGRRRPATAHLARRRAGVPGGGAPGASQVRGPLSLAARREDPASHALEN